VGDDVGVPVGGILKGAVDGKKDPLGAELSENIPMGLVGLVEIGFTDE